MALPWDNTLPFQTRKKFCVPKAGLFIFPIVSVVLIKDITLSPQTLLLYVLRALPPAAAIISIAKLG